MEGGGEKKKKDMAYVEVKYGMMDVAWKQRMLEGQESMEEMMEEQVDLIRELVEIFRKWLERMVKSEESDSEGEEEEEDEVMGRDDGREVGVDEGVGGDLPEVAREDGEIGGVGFGGRRRGRRRSDGGEG
jgi:hypothetical protein